MDAGFGVELTGGQSTISQSKIAAPYAIIGGASDLRLDRARIKGEHLALQLIGSGGGNGGGVPDGLLSLRSVLTSADPARDAIFLRDLPATFMRTTVAGLTSTSDAGVAALRHESLTRSGALTVGRSVISGYDRSIVRSAAAGRLSALTAVDSEWKVSREATTGTGTFTQTRSNIADGEPRFVDQAHDDFRLRGGDPAIDRNQQTTPDAFNVKDFIDHDPVDGDGDGKVATDAGAFEYRRRPRGSPSSERPRARPGRCWPSARRPPTATATTSW